MVKITATISVYDENGKLEICRRAKSFVRAFVDILYAQSGNTTFSAPGVPDIGNITRRVTVDAGNLIGIGGAGNTNMGPVVGTGLNAVAMTDYELQTLITHGVGAGQLQYGATAYTESVTVGASRYFTIARTFTNASGGNITVNEVGLHLQGRQNVAPAGNYYFLAERTLLTFVINNGANKTVTYGIRITI